jgi:hypothetical protein
VDVPPFRRCGVGVAVQRKGEECCCWGRAATEKIHAKAIIDDLKRQALEKRQTESDAPDLFADFNGITPNRRAEFYQHDQHWSNRMILGDSLQVMASLAERENLKGQSAMHLF